MFYFVLFFPFTLTFFLHNCDLEYAVACHSDFPVRIEGFIPPATEMVVNWLLLAVNHYLNCLLWVYHLTKGLVLFLGSSRVMSNQQWNIETQSPGSKICEGLSQLQSSFRVSYILVITVSQPHFSLYPVLPTFLTLQVLIPRALLINFLHDTLSQG